MNYWDWIVLSHDEQDDAVLAALQSLEPAASSDIGAFILGAITYPNARVGPSLARLRRAGRVVCVAGKYQRSPEGR